jgi:hypothetical protein
MFLFTRSSGLRAGVRSAAPAPAFPPLALRVGEWVEVRSPGEILATLDERARFEEVPFTPQMVEYCGTKLPVIKRAHKLCDTVHGSGGRRLTDAVFLDDVCCDGAVYGGCEMECRIVWKEAWLKRVPDLRDDGAASETTTHAATELNDLLELALRNTRRPGTEAMPLPVYSCQATQMPAATTALSVWDPRQYIEDIWSGNARLSQVIGVLSFLILDTLVRSGLGFGSALRWSYDRVQGLLGGWSYPCRDGKLPRSARTPSSALGVNVGDIVQVKSHAQVLETVHEDLANRGLRFHPEMVPYCDKSFRVSRRLRRLMNEKTGQLMELKNECLVLEGASCVGRYTQPLLCPRGMPPYWREVWLQKNEGGGSCAKSGCPSA